MKSVKKFFSKALEKMEKAYKTMVVALCMVASNVVMASAAQPKIVSGTVDLFKAVTGWLLLIIPVGAGAFIGYHALQKSMTDDQAVIAEKNKLMKNTLIGAIIAITGDGLVAVVLGFYK